MVSASELGMLLGGISANDIQALVNKQALFKHLEPRNHLGKEFIAFQASPAIVGEPMRLILKMLGPLSPKLVDDFFFIESARLRWLTPIEVLLGQFFSSRVVEPGQRGLLCKGQRSRLLSVLQAASDFDAVIESWKCPPALAPANLAYRQAQTADPPTGRR